MTDHATRAQEITTRWMSGCPHHPESVNLFTALAEIDIQYGSDFFCWKSGGDGDNGEHLMYEMDIFFEQRDQEARQAAQPVWSKDTPTVAGWYWFRLNPLDSAPIIHSVSDYEIRNDKLANGEWAGPLPLPREA